MIIDAHQHFWRYDPAIHNWMTSDMAILQQDWLPEDLAPVLKEHGVDATLAVQSCGNESDTAFLLDLAARHEWIAGVVGWVDLCRPDVEERVLHWQKQGPLVGIRHQLEDAPHLFEVTRFHRGIEVLQRQNKVYEVLVRSHQLKQAIALCQQHDKYTLVLDHLGKPSITEGSAGFERWTQHMKALSELPHVVVKLSGLVTEAAHDTGLAEQVSPYINQALSIFGPERLIWGSDWPVCRLRTEYAGVLSCVRPHLKQLTKAEREAVMGMNARRIYHLEN